ncbi:sarcosine oxidase subunit gamma [Pseudorhodobacter turbinis]|uniref:Sarcosine oxidase subunit gamma n=1 Tax=Pseudorhodobacter turbinis TaxID=2500533 RepID=A0A4P8EDK7_9RHOB|nr:sarcosine oxidase subunit gamma family protein [Pseudorhodobacter turbinis]QCO54773.1 sarcosine oxidase subunit gamma [Pseudorhodobacter turbinis]
MHDPVSALGGQTFEGFANIREIGPLGTISLRCNLAEKPLAAALKKLGLTVPAPRRIVQKNGRSVGWMSPDELLVVLPYGDVRSALETLRNALSKIHFMAEDVSDARAVFRIEGEKADQVLAKLCPVDLATLETGELRRTRAAQVAAALWVEDGGYTLVSFRSVAGYVMGLLLHSATKGAEI